MKPIPTEKRELITAAKKRGGYKPALKRVLERAKGIEPSTSSLGSLRSTTELRPQAHYLF